MCAVKPWLQEGRLQKNTAHPEREFPVDLHRALRFLFVLAAIFSLAPIAQAVEPAWNYSTSGREIGGVAVSPKGDLIAVGAGKVLFFSRNGTLLTQEPFGNDVMITADGKFTASVYTSTVYYFKNPLPGGSLEQQKVTRLWDYDLSEPVYSFDMNRDGSLIAGQTTGKNLFVMNTRTQVARGNAKVTDSIIKISGGGIVGISTGKIHTYGASGNLISTSDLTTNSAPGFLVLPSDSSAVFSDGHTIHWVNNIYDGTERWKRQVSGSVTALSIAPGGSLIVAGTDAGAIAGLNANGNLSWNYSSNPENRQGAWITCCALSDKATTIAAGSADGKILVLNSRGDLSGSFDAHENIRHIAVSADGSLVVAASDERVYAFSPGSLPVVTSSPTPTFTGTPQKNTTASSPVQTPVTVPSRQAISAAPPTELPTTYSIIRTATPSPPSFVTGISSLVLAFFLLARKRHG